MRFWLLESFLCGIYIRLSFKYIYIYRGIRRVFLVSMPKQDGSPRRYEISLSLLVYKLAISYNIIPGYLIIVRNTSYEIGISHVLPLLSQLWHKVTQGLPPGSRYIKLNVFRPFRWNFINFAGLCLIINGFEICQFTADFRFIHCRHCSKSS